MKTILITGSSRGIGKATAILAAQKGYNVIVHGKSDSEELNRTHKEIVGSEKVFFDVADKQAVRAAIDELGPIDILINNAGIATTGIQDISDVDDESALLEYRVNVLGTLHCIQAVLPEMLKNGGGSIVSLGSIKGQPTLGTMSTLTYAPTKAGVISLMKSLAKAYPSVRFNSVSPGYVETDQVASWNEETFKRINDGTVLGRMAKPEEIAATILFVASDDARYMTGTDILIDGGYSIKGK